MKDRKKILDEISRLIEEQMETLNGKVTSDQAMEYIQRRGRIQELVLALNAEVATEE